MKKFMKSVIINASPFYILASFYTLIVIVGVIYRIIRSHN